MEVTTTIYDRLIRLDTARKLVPGLALSWTPNPAATQWTFKLRPGISFSNGKAFGASDVAYTFKHILNPQTKSPEASALNLISGIDAPNSHTVIFRLSEPDADFPVLLTDYRTGIIPNGGLAHIQNGIGTGPFKLQHLDVQGTTVLVANPNYWGGRPKLARIDIIAIADANAQLRAFQAGQTDVLFSVSPQQARQFAGDASVVIQHVPTGDWDGIVFRTKTPPFNNVFVRQALKAVANRTAMVKLVLSGQGVVSCDTPVMPTDPYRWNGRCPQNLQLAKVLLRKAGYPNGLSFNLYVSNVDPTLIPLAEVYQQQAAMGGIHITIKQVPADSYFTDIWMKKSAFLDFWAERPADQILNEVFRSNAPWNESAWSNDRFDLLLNRARATLDFQKRRAYYQLAQQLLAQDGGELIPFHVVQTRLYSQRVSGLQPVSQFNIQWQDVAIRS